MREEEISILQSFKGTDINLLNAIFARSSSLEHSVMPFRGRSAMSLSLADCGPTPEREITMKGHYNPLLY